jgi:hypothetical protein
MLDPQTLALDPACGEYLAQEVYKDDFRRRHAEIEGRDSWKFERRQHFEEQRNDSRDALRRGDWDEALRLLEGRRDRLLRLVRAEQARAAPFHRVRVVERPLTPYMQWELHALRVRADCGKSIRVVGAEKVMPLEFSGLMPEVVVLGGRTLYSIRYTDEGVPDGAVRFVEPRLIKHWESYIRELFTGGEDVISYVDREVVPLPAPRMKTE